ncbi:Extracellular sulfatase SULF-1-like 2, partial [Homarus americanus]
YFGKYLNKYNGSHIPAGWQEWAGLIKNSRYYNYTIQRNGHFVKYGDQYPKDYYPHVITNEGIQFLEKNRALDPSPPMLTVLSYPAPHGPEDSAPEHAHRFFNATDHNTMAYNYAPNPDKQWLLQFIGRMHDIELKFTDLLMTKRLQTLQTVDEAVEKVINTLDALGELNNTYIFYTSDHGYHLGQFGLVKGKSMPFEFDIKVPFLVRGPGIRPGTQIDKIALNVDLAPTFLEIAGIKPPPHMDGRSLLPLLTGSGSETFPWRDNFLVESAGRHREEDALKLRQERRQHRAQGHIGTGSKGGLYTSKRERLEIICQSEEYRSPCKPEQKWECVRDEYSRWRLHKCRKSKVGGPSRTKWRQRKCVCEPDLGMGYLVKLDSAERRKQRTFLKKHTTQNLRNYGTKFIKVFSDVDSREILEQSIGLRVQRNSLFSHSRRIRSRRSTNLDLPLEDSNPVYEEDIDEDNVDTFVTEEEIRDLDVTINTLSDELENLESVSSTAATSVAGGNMSVLATSPTNATPADVRHGCRVTGTSVGCTDDVYRDPHAWKLSKVAINQQIRRLRHQLTVMKNIKKHLQDSRPDSVAESEDYEEYDETESSGDFNMIMGESDLLEPNDEDGTSTTEGSDSFQDLYGTQDTNNGYDDSMFNSSEHDSADYEVGHSGDDDDEDGPQGGEDSDDEGVIIIGNDYDVGGEVHQHGHHDDVDGNEEDRTLLEDSQPELPHILKIPGKNGQQGSKQFQLFPVRESSSHQRPPTIINETSARARCWCDKSFRLQIKQAERQKKREERLRLRLERQRVKQERRQQKEKKKLRKLKNNLAQCNYTMLNCYTHDNDHWRTPPLWHDGKFCFCMNAANNTYWCVRTINETHNFLYCEFVTGLVTYYDLNIGKLKFARYIDTVVFYMRAEWPVMQWVIQEIF